MSFVRREFPVPGSELAERLSRKRSAPVSAASSSLGATGGRVGNDSTASAGRQEKEKTAGEKADVEAESGDVVTCVAKRRKTCEAASNHIRGGRTDDVEMLRKRYPRVGKCVLCGIFAFASSHQSISGPEHTWEHLEDEELVEWASNRRGRTVNRAAASVNGDYTQECQRDRFQSKKRRRDN